MEPNAVKVPVITPVPIECEFGPEDDGWKGTCSELAISVRGGNFEQAKGKHGSCLRRIYFICAGRPRGHNRGIEWA